MINISAKYPPILNRKMIKKVFDASFIESNPDNQSYVIRDPFNNTYNPAKNLKSNNKEHEMILIDFFKDGCKILFK